MSVCRFDIEDSVYIRSDNDNDIYAEYVGMKLIVTHVSRSSGEHKGYDESLEGMGLYDLETEYGEAVPFSLYDYELE